jgi:hypothetical protein
LREDHFHPVAALQRHLREKYLLLEASAIRAAISKVVLMAISAPPQRGQRARWS